MEAELEEPGCDSKAHFLIELFLRKLKFVSALVEDITFPGKAQIQTWNFTSYGNQKMTNVKTHLEAHMEKIWKGLQRASAHESSGRGDSTEAPGAPAEGQTFTATDGQQEVCSD